MSEYASVVTREQSSGNYSENDPPLPHLTGKTLTKQDPSLLLCLSILLLLLAIVVFYFAFRSTGFRVGSMGLIAELMIIAGVYGLKTSLKQRKENASR